MSLFQESPSNIYVNNMRRRYQDYGKSFIVSDTAFIGTNEVGLRFIALKRLLGLMLDSDSIEDLVDGKSYFVSTGITNDEIRELLSDDTSCSMRLFQIDGENYMTYLSSRENLKHYIHGKGFQSYLRKTGVALESIKWDTDEFEDQVDGNAKNTKFITTREFFKGDALLENLIINDSSKKMLTESPDNIIVNGHHYKCSVAGYPAIVSNKAYISTSGDSAYHYVLTDAIYPLSRLIAYPDSYSEFTTAQFHKDFIWYVDEDVDEEDISDAFRKGMSKIRIFIDDKDRHILTTWKSNKDLKEFIKEPMFKKYLLDVFDYYPENIYYEVLPEDGVESSGESIIKSYKELIGMDEESEENVERQRKITYWFSVLHTTSDKIKKAQARYELGRLGINVPEIRNMDNKKYPTGMTRAEYRSIRYPQESTEMGAVLQYLEGVLTQ